ncbi:MAG TPA: hypothetical protein VKY73_21110 [Polyangiaceae bacterium]|nr:hypothetical protein [Polyangiaceae bacterium]
MLDGRPLGELSTDIDVLDIFGGVLPECAPKEFCLVAGIRGGKSLMAAALAVRASQVVDVSRLGPGEVPRVAVMSLDTDKAKVVLNQHLLGNLMAKPELRSLIARHPDGRLKILLSEGSVTLRHPSGREVEIKVVAGARAGGSLVSMWMAGVIFDEATRMVGHEDGVVNLDESRDAVAGRVLPGGQIIYIGSAFAPFGPVYQMVSERFGKPGPDVVVCKAKAYQLNPSNWTEEAMRDLESRNPVAYACDVLSEFKAPDATFFEHSVLQRQTRTEPELLPRDPLCRYQAAIDPGTRGNAWTLVIVGHVQHGKYAVARIRQWRGSTSEPLSPLKVLEDIQRECAAYGITSVWTDQWSVDALREISRQIGLGLIELHMTGQTRVEAFERLRVMLLEDRLELPPSRQFREDLLRVRRIVRQQTLSVELEKTADGRHADFAAALALAMSHPLPPPEKPTIQPGTPEWNAAERERLRRAAILRAQRGQQQIRMRINEVR